mgnify:CR=1 FL=1
MQDHIVSKIAGAILMALPFLFFGGFCIATFLAFLIKQPAALLLLAIIFFVGFLIYRIPDRNNGTD